MLTIDEGLATTRSVRKRLDTTRPVSRALIEECLALALQAPNGGNRNSWRWIVVDDREIVARIAAIYAASMNEVTRGVSQSYRYERGQSPREDLMNESVVALSGKLAAMPALVIPLMEGRPEQKDLFIQANMWGSIVQAVWSFFLALRARGLGSAWTTLSLRKEEEIAQLLNIPQAEYTQVGLFPVAYTMGTDFKPAWREPLEKVVRYNSF